jgi:hypothetical protein
MRFLFKLISVALTFFVSFSCLAQTPSVLQNSWFEISVYRLGEPIFQRAFLQLDGFESRQGGFNRIDQLSLTCNGDTVKDMKPIERNSGVRVGSIRKNGQVNAKVEILWVEAQNLPASITTCKEITPSEQKRVEKSFDFKLPDNDPAGQFRVDLDSGYSVTIKVLR